MNKENPFILKFVENVIFMNFNRRLSNEGLMLSKKMKQKFVGLDVNFPYVKKNIKNLLNCSHNGRCKKCFFMTLIVKKYIKGSSEVKKIIYSFSEQKIL